MRGGNRSKPKELRKVDNSRERARHRAKPQAEAPKGAPPKPQSLSPDAAAEWDRLAGILDSENRLTLSDGPWLDAAARAYSDLCDCEREVRGVEGADARGKARQQVRLARDAYRKWLGEGGGTAMTRARVGGIGPKDDEGQDEFDTFQAQGGIRRVK